MSGVNNDKDHPAAVAEFYNSYLKRREEKAAKEAQMEEAEQGEEQEDKTE